MSSEPAILLSDDSDREVEEVGHSNTRQRVSWTPSQDYDVPYGKSYFNLERTQVLTRRSASKQLAGQTTSRPSTFSYTAWSWQTTQTLLKQKHCNTVQGANGDKRTRHQNLAQLRKAPLLPEDAFLDLRHDFDMAKPRRDLNWGWTTHLPQQLNSAPKSRMGLLTWLHLLMTTLWLWARLDAERCQDQGWPLSSCNLSLNLHQHQNVEFAFTAWKRKWVVDLAGKHSSCYLSLNCQKVPADRWRKCCFCNHDQRLSIRSKISSST